MNERYTDVRLVKVPIEIDNKNQLNFANPTAQYNYFNSCEYIELDNSSYQRKDSTVRYPGQIDDLIGFNYCMYKNNTYSDKWFYAFITDMRYMSDSMTLVSIKTDVWQTWQFDITFDKSFVEREHVSNDTVGAHTIDEGLYLGELINNSVQTSSETSAHAVVATTFDVIRDAEPGEMIYNGIYSGLVYYVVGDFTSQSFIDFVTWKLANEGKADALAAIFMVPDKLTGYVNNASSSYWSWIEPPEVFRYRSYHELTGSGSATAMETVTVTKNHTSIDGYTPKNKKLLTYPYNFISVDNNAGQCYNYAYEYFSTTDCLFDIVGAITPGCSIRMIPKDYKGITANNSEGMTGGKFPICSWANDVYTNWLTQNGINIPGTSITLNAKEAGLLGGALSTLLGVGALATGNPVVGTAGISGGINQIYNTLKQDYQMSLTPPQIDGNINSGDVTYSSGNLCFSFYKKSIRAEIARTIDDFFTMFGYKVSTLKVPNITSRTYWNYIKTIDCNIHGYIPQADCLEIKNMFNAGVTFWHDPSHFLDYSQSNTIVS